MIKSMTGFGRSELVSERCKVTVEMKAVNHRYCDINIKVPRILNYLEAEVRSFLKKNIGRGKVDVYIAYEDLSEHSVCVKMNDDLVKEYYRAFRKISQICQVPNTVTSYQMGRMQDVLSLEDVPVDQEYIKSEIMEAVSQALEAFHESRKREGESLERDITDKLAGLYRNVEAIEMRYPEIVSLYRSRLTDKVKELMAEKAIDESRIVAEVVLYADKICVDEETVRLKSHITHMQEVLKEGENIGRKLDFIAQEMNREANTILSKSNDKAISNHAIDLKTDIEKIREQVQNIE